MVSSSYKILIVPFIIILISCEISDDFLVTGSRAGLFKIGDGEKKIDKLLKDYKVTTFPGGVAPSIIKYKIVSNEGKDLMHFRFQKGTLSSIKLYDNQYKTKEGLRIGSTAQEVLDKGVSFLNIKYKEREGLRCFLSELNLFGELNQIMGLEFFFDKKIYVKGGGRKIGKSAALKFFVVGDYFDIKMDTLTLEERKDLRDLKKGNIDAGKYTNEYFGVEMSIPDPWTFEDNFASVDYKFNLIKIKSNTNASKFLFDIHERTFYKDGKQILSSIPLSAGITREVSLVDKTIDQKLYRKISTSRDNELKEVCFATVKNGYGIILKGNWVTEEDLTKAEKIFLSMYD